MKIIFYFGSMLLACSAFAKVPLPIGTYEGGSPVYQNLPVEFTADPYRNHYTLKVPSSINGLQTHYDTYSDLHLEYTSQILGAYTFNIINSNSLSLGTLIIGNVQQFRGGIVLIFQNGLQIDLRPVSGVPLKSKDKPKEAPEDKIKEIPEDASPKDGPAHAPKEAQMPPEITDERF